MALVLHKIIFLVDCHHEKNVITIICAYVTEDECALDPNGGDSHGPRNRLARASPELKGFTTEKFLAS